MQTPGRKGLALTHRGSHLRLWLTVGLGLLVDLGSKHLAWRWLGPPGPPTGEGPVHDVIPGWLQLVTSRNPGIIFGLDFADGLGIGPTGARILTALLTAATCGLIFYLFAVSRPRQKWIHLLCGLVLAGALGNLYDRVLFGSVRDFIRITREVALFGRTLGWPYIFNLADVYLVVGVIGVALGSLLARPAEEEAPEGPSAPERRRAQTRT